MQSVHAGAAQTHFFVFALFLKNNFQKTFVGPVSGSLGHPVLQKTCKKDTAENKYFADSVKCLTGDYEYLRRITGCEATLAPKSFLGRKNEGGETNSKKFGTSL